MEAGLNADPVAMITTGSLMAVLFTLIVRDVFKVKPSAAFGYSLGEIAMLFGIGVWDQADATQARLRNSPLFRHRLAGAQNAVRQAWGLPQVQAPAPGEELWSNYFLMAPVEQVSQALSGEERVYLTHINTPRQVVIGGDPQGCQRVIAALKCTSLKAPFDFALHCAAMRSEYPTLVDLHTWPVAAAPGILTERLYTAAGNQPLPLDSAGIADKISSMLTHCLDFPALVRQVYAGGARVFIELGANANCTRWIDDTLKGNPYLAVSINRKGAPDHASIVRLLARLLTHKVDVDCSALYEGK
jgi:PfaB family protein